MTSKWTSTGPSERSSSDPIVTEQEVTNICRRILRIFFEYALNKIDHSDAGFERGAENFVPVVRRFVTAGERIEACLPAFPFKSANKEYKVLGKLPDKAEELALDRLNSICRRIQEIYPPGARITIISDGITYNGTHNIMNGFTSEKKSANTATRLIKHIRSGYVGLRRGSTYYGHRKEVRLHWFL